MNSRGVALILVLSFILAVVLFANIAIMLLSSQFRFTFHQTSRIRAFYASQAGINLALENLRTGAWTYGQVYCIKGPITGGLGCGGGTITDDDIPYNVQIQIFNLGTGPGGTAQLEVTTQYTPDI